MRWVPFLVRQAERWISPSLRNRAWRMLEAPERARFRRGLDGLAHSPRRGQPALSYGETLSSDEQRGVVHGGRVKLLHLAEEFPAVADFNLLYLVSSAPPKFALELVEWAKARGVKFVWNQNGVAYPGWYGTRSEEINGPMRALRRQADYIFYQSEFCRRCAEEFLGPVTAPGEIAFNCVDTAHFCPAVPPDTAVWQLLTTGSHYESYRVLSVLETVAELVRRGFPVALHLAGRLAWKDAEAEVDEKIRALGIAPQVRQTAAYRQEEAPAIYQAAHILLHPKYKDPCPTVPIEAMACGVPVIGSASGGMPELVSPEAGVLIDVPESWEGNHWPAPVQMADAVETIMRRWPECHGNARARAETLFAREPWMARHRRVFQALTPA
jgi:glycosyltransferase involved in cell wall biosynthesis